MVSPDTEKRRQAQYSLDRIRDLAADGKLNYAGRRVTLDVENLGYAPEDVCQCLQTLNDSHFCHAERYSSKGVWLDVYHVPFRSPSGALDNLYLKLKLNRGCIVVVLQSFHRER